MSRELKATPSPNGASESQPLQIVDLTSDRTTKILRNALGLLALVSVFVGFPLFLMAMHKEHPHVGAVSVDVWAERNKHEDANDARLEKKLDELGKHVLGPVDWKKRTD